MISIENALYKAEQVGLDLVEISPNTIPPVCKILDYGKFRYEKQKQVKINKKKQHTVQVKEIRLRPNTGDHDLTTKLMKAQKFLLNGDKLKVTVMSMTRFRKSTTARGPWDCITTAVTHRRKNRFYRVRHQAESP